MNLKSFLWLAAAVASVHCAGAWAAGGPMTNRDGLVVKLPAATRNMMVDK